MKHNRTETGKKTRRTITIATLHLICGLPCSGKTTFAKVLEVERSAVRLSPDEWIIRLYGPDISGEKLDAVRDPVEAVLWDLAARLLTLGTDVILENGFWSRSEREDFRTRAAQLGARCELHFMRAELDGLLLRLEERNANLPAGSCRIDVALLRDWFEIFEPPDSDELQPR